MGLNAGYFRYPTLAGDTVQFVSEDDLWDVPAAGGVARRLTDALSEVSRPLLSPDGSLVAFTSREEHHAELYCMAAEGGPARRLTWLGANAIPRAWLPDGRIVFVSDAGQPFASQFLAYAISPDGGPVERLPYGPVREVAFGPGAAVVLGRNTADPARWKRYRGGTAGRLWIDARGTGAFRPLIDLPGNLASPMWIGRRVYFISDHEGVGNIYSCRSDGRDLRRHTDHDRYYARFGVSDGHRVVYHHAAEIWLFDPETDEAHPVEVDFRSPRAQRARKFAKADQYLTGHTLHPEGHSIAIETRGKLFTMPLWDQAVNQHGRIDGVRYRHTRWLHDGASIVTVSDEDGEDALEVHAPVGAAEPQRLHGLDLGCVTDVAASPSERQVAVTNHRHELLLVDLTAGSVRVLDASPHGHLDGAAWSPDGRWIAYSFGNSTRTAVIKVCDVASGATNVVTTGEFRDYSPAWDPNGDYLFFIGHRTFNPVYDTVVFDLGFPGAAKPHLVTLRTDVPSPFLPPPKGFAAAPPQSASENGNSRAPVRIDFDGMDGRILAFPVAEGRYEGLTAIAGKIMYSATPIQGSLDVDFFADPAPTATLESYDLAELKQETLVQGINGFDLSRDGSTLVYRAGPRLRALKAGEKPAEGTEHEPPGRRSGWLDLERIRVSVDPAAEWRQMFREAWRLQRDHFWVQDMSGVDWDEVHERYLPLVEKVATRAEFSDLMWEMQGELGTSHAYEVGGDLRQPPPYAMGYLGADLELDTRSGRWRVSHVVEGDAGDTTHNSPLRAPGVNVTAGDTIIAVGGQAVGRDLSPAHLLVNQAGVPVELTVRDGRGRKPRNVVVTTLRDERPARYREWVRANRRAVHDATDGRVGYVHVPDMGPRGYSEFHRSYLAEVARDALVVDVRFNGGGHVSSVLLERLASRRVAFAVSRWEPPEPYPHDSPAGPLVAITNEWAGSDGDIFTHCFRLLGLGPVVGKRTWGGVIGISGRHKLVDGSLTTQPEYSFWFSDVGWQVENYGAEPDHEVEIRPQDYAAGSDPQLDKAIDLVVRALKRHQPLTPDVVNRPRLSMPVLPARASR